MVASAYRRHALHAKSLTVAVRATARGIPVTGLPEERLVRLHWENARAYAQWTRWGQCLTELPAIERIAPQEVRRPALRELACTMPRSPAPAATRRDAKGYASRINAA
jgi:hypothetical protein